MKRLAIILLMIAAACESDDRVTENVSSDYIVFGRFYGMCAGDHCIQIYKLTDTSIYEDTKDQYPSYAHAYEGDFVQLDNTQFEKVKDLRNEIPGELLDINETVIGEPDAGDWGGFYFEMKYKGERRFWLIDKMKSNVPEDLRSFVDKLDEDVNLLID